MVRVSPGLSVKLDWNGLVKLNAQPVVWLATVGLVIGPVRTRTGRVSTLPALGQLRTVTDEPPPNDRLKVALKCIPPNGTGRPPETCDGAGCTLTQPSPCHSVAVRL